MTEKLTSFIKNDLPFIFVKFGDGEYAAANHFSGTNCDGDPYTQKLQHGIITAIQYFSHFEHVYCGKWHDNVVPNYFDSIVPGKLNWVYYHACIMDEKSFENNCKIDFFAAIKFSKRRKILVGNELLVKAKYLLNMDQHIITPYRNWVEHNFDDILNSIISVLKDDDSPMVITCAGMGSKILIMELHKRFKKGIFIDIGSGLDYICTKKCSRGNIFSYTQLEQYFQEILPANWNDNSFNDIYKKANTNIGIHLN